MSLQRATSNNITVIPPTPPNNAGLLPAAPNPAGNGPAAGPLAPINQNIPQPVCLDGNHRRDFDRVVQFGRGFGRFVNFIDRPEDIFAEGVRREEQVDIYPTEEDNRRFAAFPALLRFIESENPAALQNAVVLHDIFERIDTGLKNAKSDDTRSLKSAILGWLVPSGEVLQPPLAANSKTNRGFNHPVTGRLLAPVHLDWEDPIIRESLRDGTALIRGDEWPKFLYSDETHSEIVPWVGFLKNPILVKAAKFIFTSPSSADSDELDTTRATRAGNARIHGVEKFESLAPIVYVASQVRFALSSSTAFVLGSAKDDFVTFYASLMDLILDPDEADNTKELLRWWNRQIFPSFSTSRASSANSTRNSFKRARLMIAAAGAGGDSSS